MKLATLFGLAVAGLCLFASTARAQSDAPKADEPAKPATTETFVYAIIKTSLGDMTIELNQTKAPISTANFLAYADKKFYDGTIFHRVIGNFMIQGGGFTPDMKQKQTDKAIKNEWQNGLKNTTGTLAMARLGGNADSATSQFFINVGDNHFLDTPRDGAGYAVFGKVVDGMDTVNKIKAVKTGNKAGMNDVPVETVTIKEIRRMTPEEVTAFKAKAPQ